MAANLPVAFGALLAGGLLLEHGVSTTKAAFSGGSASTSTTTSTSGSAPAASSASGGQTVVGAVTTDQLNAIGAQHGWTGQQIADWENVIKSESNGTTTDTNTSSGAYGIGQFLAKVGDLAANKAKYYAYGGDPNTVTGQLTAMANYIARSYGNPSAAWTFHQTHNWY